MIELLKYAISRMNDAAEWVADLIIRKPKQDIIEAESEESLEKGLTALASILMGRAVTAGTGIAVVEGLSTATVVGVEGAAIASGSAEVLAIGAALLFSATVIGKVAGRAVGRLYEHFQEQNEQDNREVIAAKLVITKV